MKHVLCWLWLATKFGITSEKITLLLEYFNDVEEIYFSRNYNNIYGLSDNNKKALLDKDLTKAKRVLAASARIKTKILVFDDENYPEILKNIPNPPYVLYVQGKVLELDKVLTIGVIGTRKSSEYGRLVTERICTDLAKAGVVTIGGLARGIDTVGAWATLEAGGVAVGVVGNGLDIAYPPENEELIKKITEKGCILSEYPPGTPPLPKHFPIRNRIIAGLSRGVLVTEAPKKSGALITAGYALENCRDVFAVPRSITDTDFLGTNQLIQQGAKLVNSAYDIICEYPYAVEITPQMRMGEIKDEKPKEKITGQSKTVIIDDKKYDKLNDGEKAIINLLKKGDMQIDELSRQLNVPVSEINIKLMMLEVSGLVKKLPGSSYQLKI